MAEEEADAKAPCSTRSCDCSHWGGDREPSVLSGLIPSTSNRFTVTFPKRRPDNIVDVGRNGFSPGDMFIFRGNLTSSGKRVGRIWAKATILRRKEGLSLAEANFRLFGKGQLTAQGRIYFERGDQGKLAITGGGGDYRRASGTVRSTAYKKVKLHFRVVTS
jgi:hypothetical protein